MINIGDRREFVWDDYIVDAQATTAERLLHHPVRKEVAFYSDSPWEGDGCDFHSIVYDRELKKYRMYYNGWEMLNPEETAHTLIDINICMMESDDGIHWVKPMLRTHEYKDSLENNIVAQANQFPGLEVIDNFFVMIDDHPGREVPQRYKAAMMYFTRDPEDKERYIKMLYSLVSDDGINWRHFGVITHKGRFDTLNTLHWNEARQRYFCYIRDFHVPVGPDGVLRDVDPGEEANINEYVRDIRVLESKDFIHWSDPEHIHFNDVEDYPLYTNAVFPYPGNNHMLVGLPTRYVERKAWTKNFDRLCGAEKRQKRCKIHPRLGLAITDCVFMCSRNGRDWYRYDDAFMRPEMEMETNWVYGDCYPATGVVITKNDLEGADDNLSLFDFENHWSGKPARTVRYELRMDGFVSMHAGLEPKKLVTKPFVFDGGVLRVNFSTSARGWMNIVLRDAQDGRSIDSGELFGNRTNRIVDFDGEVSELSGRSVVMEITLCDADFYAFQFGKE